VQESRDGERHLARIDDLSRVRVHGDRLLADGERVARAVEDRAAPGGHHHRLAMLPQGHGRVLRALDALQPEGAGQRRAEEEREEDGEDDDPAVRRRRAHRPTSVGL